MCVLLKQIKWLIQVYGNEVVSLKYHRLILWISFFSTFVRNCRKIKNAGCWWLWWHLGSDSMHQFTCPSGKFHPLMSFEGFYIFPNIYIYIYRGECLSISICHSQQDKYIAPKRKKGVLKKGGKQQGTCVQFIPALFKPKMHMLF